MSEQSLPLFCPYCGELEAETSSRFVTASKLTIIVYKCGRCGFLFKVDEPKEPPAASQ